MLIGHGWIVSAGVLVLVLYYTCHASRQESVLHKIDELDALRYLRLGMKYGMWLHRLTVDAMVGVEWKSLEACSPCSRLP